MQDHELSKLHSVPETQSFGIAAHVIRTLDVASVLPVHNVRTSTTNQRHISVCDGRCPLVLFVTLVDVNQPDGLWTHLILGEFV